MFESLVQMDVSQALGQVDRHMIKGVATTVLLVFVLWTIRVVLIRAVSRSSEILSPDQRRWVQTVKTMVWALIILGLVMIWAPQLQTAALSLTAFVVAIVIATKEVILCFTGAFMRVSTAPFRMGDWITIDGITGEVVDINAFSAKVQELETRHGTFAHTGKIIQIPNSRYFTFPIENLSYLKQYRSHIFTIAFQEDRLDPTPLMKKLNTIIEKHTASFRDEAAQAIKRVKRTSHIPLPDPAPLAIFESGDFNNMRFTVRAFLPTKEAAAIASRISEEFGSEVAKKRAALEKNETDKEKA